MSGKGSKRRPIKVSQEQYQLNWDRIFGQPDNDNPGEGGFWKHKCKIEGEHWISVGEECNWCGAIREDKLWQD